MEEFIKRDIDDIKLKLDIIFKQNCDIEYKLEKISTALLQKGNNLNYNKAVEEFLNDFMNKDI